MNAGEDVLVFYNDKSSFNQFVEIMKKYKEETLHDTQPLIYHIELVKLLSCCTMGKNVYTEIKCNSLLSLDDIVTMICHPDCIPEVKEVSPVLLRKNKIKLKRSIFSFLGICRIS